MEGLVFGIIDNGIMILGAFYGISLGRFFSSGKSMGALVGAGIGNAVSDFLGGLGERNVKLAIGTFLGCLIAMLMIPLIKVVIPNIIINIKKIIK